MALLNLYDRGESTARKQAAAASSPTQSFFYCIGGSISRNTVWSKVTYQLARAVSTPILHAWGSFGARQAADGLKNLWCEGAGCRKVFPGAEKVGSGGA